MASHSTYSHFTINRAKVFNLFGHLHAAGYEHRDINARNVIRELNGNGFRIVDLESLQPHQCAKMRKKRRSMREGLVDLCLYLLGVLRVLKVR